MRITFLLPAFAPRPLGGYRVVYEYANRLAGRGHEVTVVHPRRLRAFDHRDPPRSALQWLRMRGGEWKKALFPPKLAWFPLDPRVRAMVVPDASECHIPDGDAVVATFWATAEEVLAYGARKGRKCYLIQSHEVWGGPPERVEATWRAPLAKAVIARWLYEKGLELGCAPETLAHIPIGLDFSHFRLLRSIEERPPRVAMLASPVPLKGLADGVRALEIARASMPELRAVLFGIDPRPRALPAWIEYHRDPAPRVLVEEIYNGSSVYLCPSWLEGWHLPPAEAMACGCAVVSTAIGGVRDYAEHEATALLSPPREPEALAAHLLRALRDEPLRLRLARAGRERIAGFDWERSTTLLEAFLAVPP